MKTYGRILLTGAAGALGGVLRPAMRDWTRHLRVSDVARLGREEANEEVVRCNLANERGMRKLLEGVDAVVHMGGVSIEKEFPPILKANIIGVYNLYEAARRAGTKRIVFASSNHAIGFYKRTQHIDANDPIRPDGFYGVSKTFGESISRFYFDRYGIETACLRIGSSFPEPKDRRMLITWLSYSDLTSLVRACLFVPKLGHTIVFGASANRDSWWDNKLAKHLRWKPRDSSERFRKKRESEPLEGPKSLAHKYQGGVYVTMGPYE